MSSRNAASVRITNSQATLLDRWSTTHLASVLLFSLGSSIVTPFFGIYVAKTLGYGIEFAALLITLKVVGQRAMSVIGGVLTDVSGAKRTAICGVAMRCTAFAVLLLPPEKALLIASALLNGFGSAIYHPALRKLMFSRCHASSSLLSRVVSLRNASLNLGAAVGPLLGVWMVENNFHIAFQIIVLIYLANLLLLIIVRDASCKAGGWGALASWKHLFTPGFWKILALQFGFFWLYSHFELLIPIFLDGQLGKLHVTLAFLTNTVVVVLVQTLASRKVSLVPTWTGFLGFAGFFATFGFLSRWHDARDDIAILSISSVVLGMLCFSIGEIIFGNRLDYLISMQITPNLTATAFGIAALVGGLSLSAANAVNVKIFEAFGAPAVWSVNLAMTTAFLLICLISRR
ncbi:Multidrug resistance protein MdtH [Pandoraea terrae]|uniref:Multidrug resistance protein MdtH n=1 Tax=Pandoraea terrae TaxID=1537710 RepID=A0A5E4SRF7_9BURK|nr:MFS transporter [Pandoraea terrae]VVD76429.1 Multidrug resistance protein MdtH [Pandoraea terrae]